MTVSKHVRIESPLFRALPAMSLALLLFVAACPEALAQDDDRPEVTHDGLQLVPDSKAAMAYVKPGADFGVYDRIMLLECYVAFKKNWQRDFNREQLSLGSRISDRDVERIKGEVAELFRDVFVEELEENDGYEVTDTAADDVLLVRPAIIDLDVTAPDTRSASRSYTYVDSAGAATLYIELYDSVSGEILARAVDRKAGRDYGRMEWSTSSSNRAEGRRVMRRWAGWLREALDEVHGKSED